jgi:hypothetical protein
VAAGALPKPGTEFGPCAGACKHVDCAATRRDANSACVHCRKPIGYETRFYTVPVDGSDSTAPSLEYAHAACLERTVSR